MGRAGTRKPHDDDRLLDRDLKDLRMTLEEIVDQQAIGGISRAIAEHQHPSDAGAIWVVVHLGELHVETLSDIVGPEVTQTGARHRSRTHRIDAEFCVHRLAVLERHALHVVEHRSSQVVDSNFVAHSISPKVIITYQYSLAPSCALTNYAANRSVSRDSAQSCSATLIAGARHQERWTPVRRSNAR